MTANRTEARRSWSSGGPRTLTAVGAVVMSILVSSCASGGSAGGGAAPATDAEWRALAIPRPEPLPGAPRVAFAGLEIIGDVPWSFATPVEPELALSELVVAGLLRRRDVQFVERRRFAEAVEAERAGRSRPPGAPRAGVSAGVELIASAEWLPLTDGQVSLELRLTDTQSGALVGGRRLLLPADAEPVGTARAVVSTLLSALRDARPIPAWDDPAGPGAAPPQYNPSRITSASLERFVQGLAAEERWNWEDARRSYQAAASAPGFFEAAAALARTARLRTGGTLGES